MPTTGAMNSRSLRIRRTIFVILLLLNNLVESRKGGASSSVSSRANNNRGTSSSRSAASSSSSRSSSSHSTSSSSSSSSSRGSSSSRTVAASSQSNAREISSAGSSYKPAVASSISTGSDSLLRGNNFKAAIAGAAAGYITYKAGKAIIKSASRPVVWSGRNYYWSTNYYQKESDSVMCSMSIEDDAYFDNFAFDNGTQPIQVVWSCRANSETCCGYECCSSVSGDIVILGESKNSIKNSTEPAISTLASLSMETNVFTDCFDIKQQNPVAADGVYTIQPSNTSLSFDVYCDMTTDNGGWTVFQRRFDGSQDFVTQNWTDYEEGFGDIENEHWLGLKNLYWLIEKEAGSVQMRVDMVDCSDMALYETYENFKIGDADTNYVLLNASGANGTAGDAFSAPSKQIGSRFSTKDEENRDANSTHTECAATLKGGWWYSSCGGSHLNSLYYPQCSYNSAKQDGITWSTGFNQNSYNYSPIITKMMIRKAH